MKKYSSSITKPLKGLIHPGYLLTFIYSASVLILLSSGFAKNTGPGLSVLAIPAALILYFRIRQFLSGSYSIINKYEIAVLTIVITEIVIKMLGHSLFPVYYIVLPVIFAFLGLYPSILTIALIAYMNSYKSIESLPGLIALCLSAFLLGNLIKRYVNKRDSYLTPKTETGSVEREQEKYTSINSDSETGKHSVKKSLEYLKRLINCNTVILYLENAEGLFEISDFISNNPEQIDIGQKLAIRSGYMYWALKTRSAVIVDSVKNNTENITYYSKKKHIGSLMAVPILIDLTQPVSRPIGLLIIDNENENSFSENHKLIGNIIAERISSHLLMEKLENSIDEGTKEINSIYRYINKLESGLDENVIFGHLLDTLQDLFSDDLICITSSSIDKHSNELLYSTQSIDNISGKSFHNKNSLVGIVAETNRSLEFSDIAERSRHRSVFDKEIDLSLGLGEINSALIIPVSVQEDHQESENKINYVSGIVFMGRRNDRDYTLQDKKLLNIIIQEAAKALKYSRNLEKIKELAIKDGLSGLYNHRHFQEIFENIIARSLRYPEEISLVLLDVDNFKEVNDEYGHQKGDEIITRIGSIIKNSLRDIDISARYGGDEFAIVLPNTGETGARKVIAKIQEKIEKLTINSDHQINHLSFSIGISTFPKNGMNRESLIKKADTALYEAKNNGKNQCIHFNDIQQLTPADGNSALIK